MGLKVFYLGVISFLLLNYSCKNEKVSKVEIVKIETSPTPPEGWVALFNGNDLIIGILKQEILRIQVELMTFLVLMIIPYMYIQPKRLIQNKHLRE